MKQIFNRKTPTLGDDTQIGISKLRQAVLAASTVAVGLLGLQNGPAQAAFLGAFEGYSVFGGGAPACALCDSTVNFAVYQTEDNDWTDDAAFGGNAQAFGTLLNPQLIPPAFPPGTSFQPFAANTVDQDTNFVFFYQIVNTDPLGAAEEVLENFNIAITGKQGEAINPVQNPYSSAGYLNQRTFDNKSSAEDPLDNPNDWEPTEVQTVTPIGTDTSGVNPAGVRLDQIANPAVGIGAFGGVQFGFDPLIAPDGMSSLMFLTYDGGREWIDFVWAETASPGGFGAAGDVPGVKMEVPEPGTIILFGSGLLGLGLIRRRRQRTA